MKKRQKVRNGLMLFWFLLFPITIFYFSPVLIIQGAFNGILVGSAIVFIVQFISAIFFGRLFCGWVCPAGGLQDVCLTVNDKKAPNKLNWIRYTIWIPWIGIIVWGFLNAGTIKTNFLYQIENGISIDQPLKYIVYFFFVFLIVALSYFTGKRSFCHYVCWMSPFMIFGEYTAKFLHIPYLKLATKSSDCKACGKCSKSCPMSLDVQQLVLASNAIRHSECILCGRCANGCTLKVITYKFMR